MKQLIFTKGTGKHDQMDVVLDGVSVETIACPKQGIIPHDMVHYGVESILHKRGFVNRILHGEAASFQMQADAESDGVERLVEVFQADGWSGWISQAADMLALYQVTCHARQCAPLALDENDIEAVRNKLLELSAQWQAVSIGDSLKLDFV